MKLEIAVLVFAVAVTANLLGRETYACSCSPISSGAEYEMAKGVYRGRLARLERIREERHLIRYYFAIEHTYKGPETKELTLTYPDTNCSRPFEAGEDYLIYDAARGEIQRYCNRTGLISTLEQDLVFLDRFATNKPLLKIEGFIPGVSNDATTTPKIEIKGQHNVDHVALDSIGMFSAVVPKKRIYTVKITFPGRGEFEVTDGGLDFRNSVRVTKGKFETILEYEVDLTKTFSDYRRISFVEIIQ